LTMKPILFLCLLKKLKVLAGLPVALFAPSALAAITTPNYVQGNFAAPPTPQTTMTVKYTAAQTAGHMNVVIVGWNDGTSHISSVKDSKGNVYQLASGPTVLTGSPALSQSIYYANNISAATAGTNSVTVTFTAAANYPDIRILEYSGIDLVSPVDVSAAATGDSATSTSGAVVTKNATDLLVAGNVVWTTTAGPSSGLTQRLLTSDGDIVEDRVVTAVGSYSASAPLNSAGPWVMQMVAFRAAGSSTPTPTPTPTPAPASTALTYIQGNYATPSSSLTSVTVKYTAGQTAGHLNVVIVGWNDATAQVKSLTDSKGNAYQLAVGPTVHTGSGPASQSIYYAKNISAATAGANTVTVTFTSAAYYPDIRILEYSGIDSVTPVDVSAAATGNSTTSSSGAVMSKNAHDLLVGANLVWTSTTRPGSGLTMRLLTSDGDIAEDREVTATGSVSASAPLSSQGAWVMQMVAFRAASSSSSSSTSTSGSSSTSTPTPSPTPTPKPTPSPTPTPKPTPSPTPGSSVELSWQADPATTNSATNPVGYRLHSGSASGVYTLTTTLGNVTTTTVSNLTSGVKYYFVVTAYNSAGVDGPPSNEISFTAQ
jgi:uncharacterized protein YciI